MLTIRDKKTGLKEGWRYPGVDGKDIITNSWMNLKREVKQHYETNGQSPPDEQTITDWLCKNVAVNCYENGAEVRNLYTDPLPRGKRKNVSWGVLAPMKLLAIEGERGLGDVAARLIGPIGGDLYKKWFKKMTGEHCGCSERQEDLNMIYPL